LPFTSTSAETYFGASNGERENSLQICGTFGGRDATLLAALVCGDRVLLLAFISKELLASTRAGEGALFQFSGTARVAKGSSLNLCYQS